jgi:hypothetical protein
MNAPGQDEIITTRQDAVGRMLNAWAKDKSAAGLKLIQYENRDGQHSALNAAQYPGLKIFQPTEEDKKLGREKGAAFLVRPEPTVGNCSMAANPTVGGSLPRLYYTQNGGLGFLNQQYLSNNLIIYPEHLDHDIGGNGVGGWGDLYPANTACTIISQGSSFTDMPFVNAVISTIGAFDPDVLTTLIRKRILMPTVQAIFRQSNKMVKTEADYFTGKAHPVVFDAAQLDEEKMVIAAHTMTRAAIPPVVFLKVVSESEAKNGRNFFERPGIESEKLGETASAIARVFRSNEPEHEIVVATNGAGDILGRVNKLNCVLLRGDPKLVKIESTGTNGEIRIRVKWHMPMITETGIRSHRVDIGVFANNGVSISAPAFITFYMLPNEVRSYDSKGRVSEIFYEAPNPDMGLPPATTDLRWLEVFRCVVTKGSRIASGLMEQTFSAAQRGALDKTLSALLARVQGLEALKNDVTKKDEAAKLQSAIEHDLSAALSSPAPGDVSMTTKQMIERAFDRVADQISLFTSLQQQIEKLAATSSKTSAPGDLAAEVKRLIDLGVLIQDASGAILTVHAPDQLSSGERHLLRCLNLLVMSQVLFPKALDRSTAPAYVDPRLSLPKSWRDVFRYDAKGNAAGWVRYFEGRTYVFDSAGRLLPDGTVAPDKAVAVTYVDDGKGRLTFSH